MVTLLSVIVDQKWMDLGMIFVCVHIYIPTYMHTYIHIHA